MGKKEIVEKESSRVIANCDELPQGVTLAVTTGSDRWSVTIDLIEGLDCRSSRQ